MLETAAAQALLVIESIRRVTGKLRINNSLHCLTLTEGQIEMIEEKTRVPNSGGAQAWIVRDKDDKPWGPFADAGAANVWAQKKWPDDDGCVVEALWTPD